jgi:hypothetical protein
MLPIAAVDCQERARLSVSQWLSTQKFTVLSVPVPIEGKQFHATRERIREIEAARLRNRDAKAAVLIHRGGRSTRRRK